MMHLGQVESYAQRTQYTCGAATLRAVLKHYGVDIEELTLACLIGVNTRIGSTSPQIVDAAKRLGYLAELRYFRSLDELKQYTDQDIPVIANILSFRIPNEGHFVVVTEVGDDYVKMMDPSAPGNWRTISHEEMKKRWALRDSSGVVIVPALGYGTKDRPTERSWCAHFGFNTPQCKKYVSQHVSQHVSQYVPSSLAGTDNGGEKNPKALAVVMLMTAGAITGALLAASRETRGR